MVTRATAIDKHRVNVVAVGCSKFTALSVILTPKRTTITSIADYYHNLNVKLLQNKTSENTLILF